MAVAPEAIHYEAYVGTRLYHGIRRAVEGQGEFTLPLHSHDYYELTYVVDGEAEQLIGERVEAVTLGWLGILGPRDVHAFHIEPGMSLALINVSIPAETWAGFVGLAPAEFEHLEPPRTTVVARERRVECLESFERAVVSAQMQPSALELCRFLGTVLPLLRPAVRLSPTAAAVADVPEWLTWALAAMSDSDENLRGGTARLVELTNVSRAHLSRTIRRHYATTTALVNELRLRRAAFYLRASTTPIATIASDCGFKSLSHFYRSFNRRFGAPPAVLRDQWRLSSTPFMAS